MLKMRVLCGGGPKVLVAQAALLLLVAAGCVSAWGGRFNRFNPTALNSYGGYGGAGSSGNSYYSNYGKEKFGVEEKVPSLVEALIEEEEEEDPCSGKQCTANEHCCDGHVCVDVDENDQNPGFGTCLPIYGKKQGEECYRDHDCEAGFLCLADAATGEKSCQAHAAGTQTLGEDCSTSSDCNISKGLCCKLQRRARSQPKKICTYFADPLQCIGHVSHHLVRQSVQHTAGEKRQGAHPDYRHLK